MSFPITHLTGNLRRLRAHRGYSADVVANAIGLSRSTLSAYEQGASEPSASKLLALGIYYRMALDILLAQDLTLWPASRIEEYQRAY